MVKGTRKIVPRAVGLVLGISVCSQAHAQSTPSEFAEMSLTELFEQSIDDADGSSEEESPWSFAFQYKMVEFEHYLDGSDRVSRRDVLWSGPPEERTNKNFPVVPTEITQKAHVLSVGYEFAEGLRGHLTVPHIEQSTDHVSIVPGYDTFEIETSGIGDVVLSGSYRLSDTDSSQWWLSLGVSLPTGSIDEEGDTPRAPGDQQLPYTMQLGSGTYDFPLEISYQNKGRHDINVSLSANIRSGENDRDYRLGNKYSLAFRYRFHLSPVLKPYASIDFQYSESIHGADESLLVPGPFPYPASITNPDLYGGEKIGGRIGLSWQISGKYRLSGELGKPLYQHLNGPQPEEDWRSSLQISRVF